MDDTCLRSCGSRGIGGMISSQASIWNEGIWHGVPREKVIAHPQDSRLYHKALKVLVRQAKRAGIRLRQLVRYQQSLEPKIIGLILGRYQISVRDACGGRKATSLKVVVRPRRRLCRMGNRSMPSVTPSSARVRDIAFAYGFYLLLAALVLLFTFISNSFLTLSNWMQISIAACLLLAASSGLTLVLITGNIDLSIGSIAYLAAAVVFLTNDYPPAVSIIAALATGMIFGLINGLLVAYLRMNALLTTLGLLIAYRGISLVLTGGTVQKVSDGMAALGGIKLFESLPLVFLISLGLMIVLQIILSRTRFGAYCYAIGNSEGAAEKSAFRSGRSKQRRSASRAHPPRSAAFCCRCISARSPPLPAAAWSSRRSPPWSSAAPACSAAAATCFPARSPASSSWSSSTTASGHGASRPSSIPSSPARSSSSRSIWIP